MGEADTRLRLPRSSTLAENEKAPFGFHQGGCVLTLTHSEPDEALGVDGSKKTRLAWRTTAVLQKRDCGGRGAWSRVAKAGAASKRAGSLRGCPAKKTWTLCWNSSRLRRARRREASVRLLAAEFAPPAAVDVE